MSQVDYSLWFSLIEFLAMFFIAFYGLTLLYVFDKFVIFFKILFRIYIQLTSITNCIYNNVYILSKYKNIKNLK